MIISCSTRLWILYLIWWSDDDFEAPEGDGVDLWEEALDIKGSASVDDKAEGVPLSRSSDVVPSTI